MRKQTKLVAVLSAAALLAMGASMTSFAAGWEKDDAGIWHYYDSDDEMVYDEWKKDGAKWFYLDEDGDMLVDSWVDDEYYVGDDGAMLVNQWKKTYSDEDMDDPDEDGEYWYYFGSKGKKITDDDKKINGRTYYFDEDGKMKTGWQEIGTGVYYLGTEDEGWRAENQWLWLEKSGNLEDDDDDDVEGMVVLNCTEEDDCDDEGWYWFQSSGKLYNETGKRKINGKYYIFNEHGQMLYEWINNDTTRRHGSYAQLDGNLTASEAQLAKPAVSDLLYYNSVEDGSRGTGWYELDGAEDRGNDNDTDWYYIDDGEVKYADSAKDFATYDEDGEPVYVQRIKIEGKYFAFNEEGQMQTGLQYCADDDGFYYFDDSGYQKTGRVSGVECDDDDYNFSFVTSNGKNGQGVKGEKDNYLYFNGKRLEADDDYRLWFYNGDIYLTNTKGKIQKANSTDGKEFDVENKGIADEDVTVKTDKSGKVQWISVDDNRKFSISGTNRLEKDDLLDLMANAVVGSMDEKTGTDAFKAYADAVKDDMVVSIPSIELYDDMYTYWITVNDDGEYVCASEDWMDQNVPENEE